MVGVHSLELQCWQLPITRNKTPYFQLHISVSESVIHCVVGHRVVQPCTCKEYIILGYFPILQSNHDNIMMTSICTDQYCTRPSAMLGLGQWVEQCNQSMLAFLVGYQANIYIYIPIYIYILFLSHPLAPPLTTKWPGIFTSINHWTIKAILH